MTAPVTVSSAPTTMLRAFYCTTTGCRMRDHPIGYADATRARLYCGECRRWNSYVNTVTTSG